jgi:hypothetical protein
MVLFKGATRRLSSGSTDDASGRTESIAGCGRMQQRILHGFTQHEGRQVYFYLILVGHAIMLLILKKRLLHNYKNLRTCWRCSVLPLVRRRLPAGK